MLNVARVKGARKRKGKGQEKKLRMGKHKKRKKQRSPYCAILYLILGKSIFLLKLAFFAELRPI